MDMPGKLKFYLIRVAVFLMPAVLIIGMSGFDCNGGGHTSPSQNLEIRTWYDLDQVRHNLAGNHTLMNDLDSGTPGYEELASPTANKGKGWQPIGYETMEGGGCGRYFLYHGLAGTFGGQGYEIRDLFINRPEEGAVGLVAYLVEGGIIRSVGLVNVDVTGRLGVGSVVAQNERGTVSDCYSTGSVTGTYNTVGGLVGWNGGVVSGSHSSGIVSGDWHVGGLVGYNRGTMSSCHSTADVTGNVCAGGLVGSNAEAVSDCYSSGSVTGNERVGGLAGCNGDFSTVNNSHSSSSVTGKTTVGGLVGNNGYAGTVSGSYFTGSVTGDAEVGGLVGKIAYGIVNNAHYDYDAVMINDENLITIGALYSEDFAVWLDSDRFLDIDERLAQEDGYYLIDNVTEFKQLLAFGQDGALRFRLTDDLNLSNEPNLYIPYLAGEFDGNGYGILGLSLSYDSISALGLFGYLAPGGNVTRVRAENVNVRGYSAVGALVGLTWESAVSESQSSGIVTGSHYVGGLVGSSIRGTVSNSHSIANVTGEYAVGGLIGVNSGTVGNSCSAGSVIGNDGVGGLIGTNNGGAVTNCYAPGSVTGTSNVGGLVGLSTHRGRVSNCYSAGSVIGDDRVGGLIGTNDDGSAVTNCYAAGSVTGISNVGGLVGQNYHYYSEGTVSGSFWDMETSGQATSVGGTGTSSAEMKRITTFAGAAWNITAVADPVARNASYVWNIVDVQTYPFLSWQSVP